jgi:hypothetical protein
LLPLPPPLLLLQSGSREVGETAVIGYFQQQPPPVEEGLRLIDYIRCDLCCCMQKPLRPQQVQQQQRSMCLWQCY